MLKRATAALLGALLQAASNPLGLYSCSRTIKRKSLLKHQRHQVGNCLHRVLPVLGNSVFCAYEISTVAPSKTSQYFKDPYHRILSLIYYHKGRGVSATV